MTSREDQNFKEEKSDNFAADFATILLSDRGCSGRLYLREGLSETGLADPGVRLQTLRREPLVAKEGFSVLTGLELHFYIKKVL